MKTELKSESLGESFNWIFFKKLLTEIIEIL